MKILLSFWGVSYVHKSKFFNKHMKTSVSKAIDKAAGCLDEWCAFDSSSDISKFSNSSSGLEHS